MDGYLRIIEGDKLLASKFSQRSVISPPPRLSEQALPSDILPKPPLPATSNCTQSTLDRILYRCVFSSVLVEKGAGDWIGFKLGMEPDASPEIELRVLSIMWSNWSTGKVGLSNL